MGNITVEWLAIMVSEALIARGVDTTAEREQESIERWLEEEKAKAMERLCEQIGHVPAGYMFSPCCANCGVDL